MNRLLAVICDYWKGHAWLVKRHGKVAVSKTCARCGTVRAVKHRKPVDAQAGK
jgi:hypothetical protein